jgi:hypothetical protein
MKAKSSSSTSHNLVQALVRMKHLETWELQHQLKTIDRQKKKFRDFNDRQKVSFMQEVKDRRKDWWKFDSRIRDVLCKEFDNHILNCTKNTVINQYLKPDPDVQLINEIGSINTPRDLFEENDAVKSKSLIEPTRKNKIDSPNDSRPPVKLPSIINKLCADTSSSGYFETLNSNKYQSTGNLLNKTVLFQPVSVTAELDVLPKLKRLPKLKPNLSKSMSRLEREECIDFIRTSGLSSGEEEAFYDTTHRFLKRTPFYVETKDFIRKCASEDLYKQKCERREKRRANKPVLKDHRFASLIDILNTGSN